MNIFINSRNPDEIQLLSEDVLNSGNSISNVKLKVKEELHNIALVRKLRFYDILNLLNNSDAILCPKNYTEQSSFNLGYFYGSYIRSSKIKFIFNLNDDDIFKCIRIKDPTMKFGSIGGSSIIFTVTDESKLSDFEDKLVSFKDNKIKSIIINSCNTTKTYHLGLVLIGLSYWYKLCVSDIEIIYINECSIESQLFSEAEFTQYLSEDELSNKLAGG